jgi:hypothetical protein
METLAIRELTPYEDVNEILVSITQGASEILGNDLVGLYLTGSLSYDDFNPGRSDIDLVSVVRQPLSKDQLEKIQALHEHVEQENESWAKRIECSYIPVEMLSQTLPPKAPRPYVGEGKFYAEAPYGNEWLINNYLLSKHGIALKGPDFRTLISPIDIEDVKKACVRDVFKEWEPKINDPDYLRNSHYQSYVVLNICRVLYTVMKNELASKRVSIAWAREEFPQWGELIQEAENWKYGQKMHSEDETKKFLKFVIDTLSPLRSWASSET